MKILVINNNTIHFTALIEALSGHDVEVRNYKPGLDFSCDDKDVVILSGGGGEGLEIHDEFKPGKLWYADQMRFIKTSSKPIIGICMGFEIICRTYGSKVEKMTSELDEFIEIQTTSLGKKHFGFNKLKQFEAHSWAVPAVSKKHFDVLATSKSGVEIIKHKSKKIFATQFHPEKGGTLDLKTLLSIE